MPIILFILKFALKLFALAGILKMLAWVFNIDNDNYTETKNVVGWFREVRARPSILLKPLAFFLTMGIGGYYFIDFAMHSQSTTAANLREFAHTVWPSIKWTLIPLTVIGLNHLNYVIFFKSDDGGSFFENWGWVVLPGFLTFALGYRNPIAWFIMAIILNSLLAWGIYHQLPPDLQLWLDPHLKGLAQVIYQQ